MKFEYHCLECQRKLGKTFGEVHKWLDALMHDESLSMYEQTKHRKFRHNEKGITEIRRMYGDDAAIAARLHIISDLKMDGNWDGDRIPKDEKDYVNMGLW